MRSTSQLFRPSNACTRPFQIITRTFPSTLSYSVPAHIPRPPYIATKGVPSFSNHIPIKTTSEIKKLRESCLLAKHILDYSQQFVLEGMTTQEIDVKLFQEIVRCGAYPSPFGYMGFKKSVCTSVNNVAVHGIPDARALVDGDIVNIDVTVFLNGFHGDTSRTFLVGNVDKSGRDLVIAAKEALRRGIQACEPMGSILDIGHAIKYVDTRLLITGSDYISKETGYSICNAYAGHGIGEGFHEPPLIYHSTLGDPVDSLLEPGMAFTIEPIINEGSAEVKELDEWTVVTADGLRSAQFEHTLLVTEHGIEILT